MVEISSWKKFGIVAMVLFSGALSIASSIGSIQGTVNRQSYYSRLLTDKQLSHIFVYSIYNLIWVCLLLPSYLVALIFRKEQLLPFVSCFVFLCNTIRIILYYSVTATEVNSGLTFRYLAIYNPPLETMSLFFLTFTWLNACVPT